MAEKNNGKVVLAYSGGLDTSAIVPWLIENLDCEVVCFCGDVGQGADELTGVEEKAKASGASACYVADLRREFVEDFVFPTLLTGAIYEGRYLLGTSMARPILAKGQIEVARDVGAVALAHGCTGKGNDQVRFEATAAALAPDLEIIAPWRHPDWTLNSREKLLGYLKERKIPTTASPTKLYSRDRNLWHISHEGGAIEDINQAPPDDVWMLTTDPASAPDEPRDVTIAFNQGRLVAVDGSRRPAHELIETLNTIAGQHGVGRIDIVENRLVGMKSRGLYETPGGTVLFEALRGLEEIVLDRDTRAFREHLGQEFAKLVYDGRWYAPLREAVQAAAEKIAEPLTGEVDVRLFKGRATTIRRRSPNTLYDERFATFGEEEVYKQADAAGFIRLFTLPMRIRAIRDLE
ncbi:MAG: argininosuccinate synthase [Phycisphaerales bacterium]|nr:argininosuccinate synthase [Phycisphaerales bacterium]